MSPDASPSPTPPPDESKSLGEGSFTGRKANVRGQWLAEVSTADGRLVWVVMPEEPK